MSREQKLDVIVLAAGLSSRMGSENKLLLPFEDSTIIQNTISNIIQADFDNIIVVIGHDSEALTNLLQDSFPTIKIVLNPHYERGQVTSVKAGLQNIQVDSSFMIGLGDMPFLQSSDYQEIKLKFENCNRKKSTIFRPVSNDGQIGNPVIFDASFREAVLQNQDLDSSQSVIKKEKESFVKWSTQNPNYFRDIDTKEDYQKWVK